MHKDLNYKKFCNDQASCNDDYPEDVFLRTIWFISDFIKENCAPFEDKFVVDLEDFEV